MSNQDELLAHLYPNEQPAITKQQFLDYFHSDAYAEELTTAEKKGVWLTALAGSSDLTKQAFEQLCAEYSTDLSAVLADPDEIQIKWHIDDVFAEGDRLLRSGDISWQRAQRITRSEAVKILRAIKDRHDATQGVTFELIAQYITEEIEI